MGADRLILSARALLLGKSLASAHHLTLFMTFATTCSVLDPLRALSKFLSQEDRPWHQEMPHHDFPPLLHF